MDQQADVRMSRKGRVGGGAGEWMRGQTWGSDDDRPITVNREERLRGKVRREPGGGGQSSPVWKVAGVFQEELTVVLRQTPPFLQ